MWPRSLRPIPLLSLLCPPLPLLPLPLAFSFLLSLPLLMPIPLSLFLLPNPPPLPFQPWPHPPSPSSTPVLATVLRGPSRASSAAPCKLKRTFGADITAFTNNSPAVHRSRDFASMATLVKAYGMQLYGEK